MVRNNRLFRRTRLMIGIASAVAASFSGSLYADSPEYEIDIKSQNIGSALVELSRESGVQIMLPRAASDNVQVYALKGNYTLSDALDALLVDTGLSYEFTAENVVLVTKPEDAESEGGKSKKEQDVEEEIVITGSRIITDPAKLTRQITTFSREDIERSGQVRLDEFLNRLPQNVNAPNNNGSGLDNTPFGLGNNVFAGSSVNLRGLGAQYTLILIDGRRPARGGQFGTIADISNIPLSRVDRIEILFDGAAAIYGADAIGGVVNIITDREYEGTELDISYGQTTRGGGDRLNASIGRTFKWEEGSLTANFSYQSQGEIDGAQRNINFLPGLELPVTPSSPGNIQGPSFTGMDFPILFVQDLNGDGDTLDDAPGDNVIGQDERISGGQLVADGFGGSFPVPRDLAALAAAGYTPVFGSQLPEVTLSSLYDLPEPFALGESVLVPREGFSLSPKDETFSIGASLDQNLSDDLKLFLSASYSTTEKESGTLNNLITATVTADNPANVFQFPLFFGTTTGLPSQRRFVDQSAYDIQGSLAYDINDDWALGFDFSYGVSKSNSLTLDRFDTQTLGIIASGFIFDDTGNRIPTDVSIFDPLLGAADRQQFQDAFLLGPISTSNKSESTDIELRLDGVLGTLPAGDVRTSLTASYRKQSNDSFSQENRNLGIFSDVAVIPGFSAADGETVLELEFGDTAIGLGGELVVPLVSEANSLPGVNDFLFNVSGRYESYSGVDDKGLNWAAGFNWGITESFTVRANRTYSQRVPDSVRQQRPIAGPTTDPQGRFTTGLVFEDDGVTFVENPIIGFLIGGAEHLTPEQSYGTAVGFIYTPAFADGLTINLNISESDITDQIGAPGLIDGIFTVSELTDAALALNPLVSYVTIDNHPFIPGQVRVLQLDQREFNVGEQFSRGADLEVGYNWNTEVGSWLFSWRHQYVDKATIIPSTICDDPAFDNCALTDINGELAPVNIAGEIDTRLIQTAFPLPEHRGLFDLSWSHRGVGVTATGTYQKETSRIVEAFSRDPFTNEEQVNVSRITTKPQSSLDMNITYEVDGDLFDAPKWLEGARFGLSVTNVWFKEQQISREILSQEFDQGSFNTASNFNTFGIDPRGRNITLNFIKEF